MTTRLIPLIVLLGALAGVTFTPVSHAAPPDPEARAREVLASRAGEHRFRPDLADLQVVGVRSGIGGDYVRFQQTADGIPVEGAQVVVGLPHDGKRPAQVSTGYSPMINAPGIRHVSAAAALKAAFRHVNVDSRSLRAQPSVEEMYIAAGKDKVLGWRITIPAREPLGTWIVGVRADTGEVLYASDLLRFDSGRVFDPNPPRDSGGTVPPPFDCDSVANEALLSGQYATKTLQGITPSQTKLRGEFVDLTGPGIIGGYKPAGLASEASLNFVYGCNDDRFEEAMVYYHLDTTQRKIQSLGFSGTAGIVDRPIPAHAHYFSDCNAFYDPADRGVHFGDSDICTYKADAAEDADVIVHEYGHAVQDDQVPAWGFGAAAEAEEAWAMGEGFSDFLAAAMFGDTCLGEWFSFGGPCLRDIENTSHYPEDYDACRPAPPKPAEPHCAGLIWGGALWDLVQALGSTQAARDTALTLVLESHFLLDPLATFAEAAAAIRQADQLVYGGAHSAAIDSVFAARGIATVGGVSDFPYAYLRIRHTYRGDLDVDILVGSTSSPVCTVPVWAPANDPTDDLVGYVDLPTPTCGGFLPPTPAQPWHLRVSDMYSQDIGTIEEFEIVLAGPQRCIATDVPLAIPDAGGFVYATVDCSNLRNALCRTTTETGSTTPPNCMSARTSVPCGGSGRQMCGRRA